MSAEIFNTRVSQHRDSLHGCGCDSRGPTRFQITYALVEISFQNTKTVFKTQNQFSKQKISFQNTKQSVFKTQIQFTKQITAQIHKINFPNRKYSQLQISKTSFSIGYE